MASQNMSAPAASSSPSPEPSILACPGCGKGEFDRRASALVCRGCGSTFPVLRDAIDFRDASLDRSVGIEVERDRLLAAKLDSVFDELQTFNELFELWLAIHYRRLAGAPVAELDPREILREDNIRPKALTAQQLGHGQAILDKIPLYLEGTGLPALPRGIALEDGSGHGFFVNGLSAHFDHLFVVDLSLPHLLLARKMMDECGRRNVTLVCANVERLPFQDECFDFIHSNNVVEHVTNQALLFSEARRTLKRSGLLFVISPNRYSIYFEPHFRLPGFGFIPKPIRRKIIWRRQNRDISDISLLSLREVKRLASREFGSNVATSFIPRRLRQTATGGGIRNALTKLLNSAWLGGAVNFLVNKAALGIMPYHTLLCAKTRTSPGKK